MKESLRIVVVAPDLVSEDADDALAATLAERSRQLRIGLLENGYNLVAVLPADVFLAERIRANPRISQGLEKLAGVFLIGFGVKLALQR